jgi:hypothetical protein
MFMEVMIMETRKNLSEAKVEKDEKQIAHLTKVLKHQEEKQEGRKKFLDSFTLEMNDSELELFGLSIKDPRTGRLNY